MIAFSATPTRPATCGVALTRVVAYNTAYTHNHSLSRVVAAFSDMQHHRLRRGDNDGPLEQGRMRA
ncbi:hypothetical protein B296_00030354, partial [Ensete ventricosum]